VHVRNACLYRCLREIHARKDARFSEARISGVHFLQAYILEALRFFNLGFGKAGLYATIFWAGLDRGVGFTASKRWKPHTE
jgi:hypothetical protein